MFASQSNNLNKLLNNGEIDFFIDEFSYDDKFVSKRLKDFSKSILFVSKENYDKYKDVVITEEYLKNNKLCLVSKNRPSILLSDKYNLNYDYVESTPILLNKIFKNDIIGFSLKILVEDELKSDLIKELKTDIILPESGGYVTYRESAINNKIKKIIDVFLNNGSKDIK